MLRERWEKEKSKSFSSCFSNFPADLRSFFSQVLIRPVRVLREVTVSKCHNFLHNW